MHVAAFVGSSKSGKTTLITALIRRFVTEGRRVAAIKHTHHALNDERRGDTHEFEEAGANPVIFASNDEAVIFSLGSTRRIRFDSPKQLLDEAAADIVLIEGFKNYDGWPRVELDRNRDLSVEEALTILDKIWRIR